MIINKIYETQNLLSLYLVSFLVGLRTYQHRCSSKYVLNVVSLLIMQNICTEKQVDPSGMSDLKNASNT
jgi:hypothetical protein